MNVLIGGQTKHTTPPYAVSSGVPDYRMAILRAKHKHTVSSQRVVMCKRWGAYRQNGLPHTRARRQRLSPRRRSSG